MEMLVSCLYEILVEAPEIEVENKIDESSAEEFQSNCRSDLP
jgi:hypothetical protein